MAGISIYKNGKKRKLKKELFDEIYNYYKNLNYNL